MKEKFKEVGTFVKNNSKEIGLIAYIGVLMFGVAHISVKFGAAHGFAKGYKAGTIDAYEGVREIMKSLGDS